jgi:hypothetical protein
VILHPRTPPKVAQHNHNHRPTTLLLLLLLLRRLLLCGGVLAGRRRAAWRSRHRLQARAVRARGVLPAEACLGSGGVRPTAASAFP